MMQNMAGKSIKRGDLAGVNMPSALDRLKHLMKTGKPYKEEMHVAVPVEPKWKTMQTTIPLGSAGPHGWELPPTQKQLSFISPFNRVQALGLLMH